MKKIIFEQTGNIITTLLIAFATIQSILLSPQPTKNSSHIIFGSGWLMLALWGALFYLLKHLYQKCLKDGYQIKKGELSSSDEREKEVGHLALKRTYQALLFFLIFTIIATFFFSLSISTNITILSIFIIVMLTNMLTLVFLTYLIAWIIYERIT